MKSKELKNTLTILTKALEKNYFGNDIGKIHSLCNKLKNIEQKIPNLTELEELRKDIDYLEIKYDDFNDLSYYFNPLYIRIKRKIHDEVVKKIREENRRKRGMN